jgi:hypothetical protein
MNAVTTSSFRRRSRSARITLEESWAVDFFFAMVTLEWLPLQIGKPRSPITALLSSIAI